MTHCATVDEEPKLKYQRLGNAAAEMLKKDAASCLSVHDKFLVRRPCSPRDMLSLTSFRTLQALGTHWGMLHVLDFAGNEIKRFPAHTATVNCISIDLNGEFLASCSDDGKVVINSLYQSDTQSFSYKRPVKAVSLDPEYGRKNSKMFVTGGLAGQLILNEKGPPARRPRLDAFSPRPFLQNRLVQQQRHCPARRRGTGHGDSVADASDRVGQRHWRQDLRHAVEPTDHVH